MTTVNGPTGKPYLSIHDADTMIRIQLHSYDDIGPFYLNIDKQAIPQLVKTLEHFGVEL
jgi:hypothetical protein